jgi:hypothetical protein
MTLGALVSAMGSHCHGESGWCSDWTSTPGVWEHTEVQFLLCGVPWFLLALLAVRIPLQPGCLLTCEIVITCAAMALQLLTPASRASQLRLISQNADVVDAWKKGLRCASA